jgi:hypothetical protein
MRSRANPRRESRLYRRHRRASLRHGDGAVDRLAMPAVATAPAIPPHGKLMSDRRDAAEPSQEQPASGAEESWSILGLKVARKTEILALAAFMISISGILWQLLNYARGPVISLFPSDQVTMTAANKLGRNYAGQDNLLALIATMAFVNEGDTGKNGVIRREYIGFDLGNRHIEHRWYEFGSSDVQDGNITFKRTGEASPLPVTAGSAISHETLFAAWENDCENAPAGCDPGGNFVKWDDFLKAIKTNNRLVISTSADIYPSKRLTASCVVRLRDWEIAILEKEQWLTATCAELGRPGQRTPQRRQGGPEIPK